MLELDVLLRIFSWAQFLPSKVEFLYIRLRVPVDIRVFF